MYENDEGNSINHTNNLANVRQPCTIVPHRLNTAIVVQDFIEVNKIAFRL